MPFFNKDEDQAQVSEQDVCSPRPEELWRCQLYW